MKTTFLLCFFLGILSVSNELLAQNDFANIYDKVFGGTDWEIGDYENNEERSHKILPLQDGGYIIGLSTNSDISGDIIEPNFTPLMYVGLYDMWILRLDAEYNIIWQRRLGGADNDYFVDLEITSAGEFLIAGNSKSDIGGTITQEPRILTNIHYFDYYVTKLDHNGNVLWDKRYGGSHNDILTDLILTTDENIILGGHSSSESSFDKSEDTWDFGGGSDFWIVKTGIEGDIIWEKDLGGNDEEYLSKIIELPDNSLLLSGTSGTSYPSGNKTDSNFDAWPDMWVLKIDENGNPLWDKSYGGPYTQKLDDAIPTQDGGFILAGIADVTVLGGDMTGPSYGLFDVWVIKCTIDGSIDWQKLYGGSDYEESLGEIRQTNDEGFILGCTTYSENSGHVSGTKLGIEQFWILKLSSGGLVEWDKTVQTIGHEEGKPHLLETSPDCFILTAQTGSEQGGDKTADNWSTYDFWLYSLCTCKGMFPDNPEILSEDSLTICDGESLLLCNNISADVQWSNSEIGECIEVVESGDYSFTIQRSSCSYTSNSVALSILPIPLTPIISIVDNEVLCNGDTIYLQCNYNNSNLWMPGNIASSLLPVFNEGPFSVKHIDENGCVSDNGFIFVNELEIEPIITAYPELICDDSSITLFSNYSWNNLWQNNFTGDTFEVYSPGIYNLMVTDTNGCYGNSSIEITQSFSPIASFSYSQTNNLLQFENTIEDGVIYIWDFGDGTSSTQQNPTHEYAESGAYEVLLNAINDCGTSETSQIINVSTDIDEQITVPRYIFIYAEENLQIESEEVPQIIKAYNVLGELFVNVYPASNKTTINCAGWPKGYYIFKLDLNRSQYVYKLFIQ